jgi:hypothetical protein
LPKLRRGRAAWRIALPQMRGVQPNLRASSSYIEPERICGLLRRAGAARRILVLVTSRRFSAAVGQAMRELVIVAAVALLIGIWAAALVVLFLR